MQELEQWKSDRLLKEEIRNAIQEKLNRFIFPCPHCGRDISDEHFSKEQRAFGYINEVVRKVLEEQIVPKWEKYKWLIIQELEKQKVYENFQQFKRLKEIIKESEQKIIYLQSPKYIEDSVRVRKLEEDKKTFWKKYEISQNKNKELQKMISDKEKEIQNLILRTKGQVKGQDLEEWLHEMLLATFDGQDEIKDISRGQIWRGKRADFVQEVLLDKNNPEKVAGRIVYETKNTEKWNNNWVGKLEKDMVSHHADYGFIIYRSSGGNNHIRFEKAIDPRRKIFVTDDSSVVNLSFAIKAIREAIISKYKVRADDSMSARTKAKKIERWIRDSLPKYIISLENQLRNQEKMANHIIDKVNEIKRSRDKIHSLVMNEIHAELRKICL